MSKFNTMAKYRMCERTHIENNAKDYDDPCIFNYIYHLLWMKTILRSKLLHSKYVSVLCIVEHYLHIKEKIKYVGYSEIVIFFREKTF